jgi:hypothetical protein
MSAWAVVAVSNKRRPRIAFLKTIADPPQTAGPVGIISWQVQNIQQDRQLIGKSQLLGILIPTLDI